MLLPPGGVKVAKLGPCVLRLIYDSSQLNLTDQLTKKFLARNVEMRPIYCLSNLRNYLKQL